MMASNHTDSGHEFFLPPSSPAPNPHYQQPRKKRTKLIKIDQNLVLSGPGSSSASTPTDAATASRPKCNGKKPDPSAPKITRPCTECGKKFWSWKALFGHMRCHPERQWRGINPPPNLRRPVPDQVEVQQRFCDDDDVIYHCAAAAPLMTAEDHEVAASLLLLACTTDDRPTATTTTTISLENYQTGAVVSFDHNDIDVQVQEEQQGRFECSSCKKVFGSHQALGGHRASHKNVKGCFAITRTSDGCDQVVVGDDQQTGSRSSDNDVIMREMNVEDNMLMQMGHRCGICFRVFSSGQALGGHKRCHWEKGEEASSSSMNVNAVVAAAAAAAAQEGRGLDLNLPAPVEDHSETSSFYNSSSSPAAARAAPTLDLRLGL